LSSSSSSSLARQPFVSPGLPQNYSPFFSIQCHTPPVLCTQNSNVLTHTHSSHLNFGLPTFLVPSGRSFVRNPNFRHRHHKSPESDLEHIPLSRLYVMLPSILRLSNGLFSSYVRTGSLRPPLVTRACYTARPSLPHCLISLIITDEAHDVWSSYRPFIISLHKVNSPPRPPPAVSVLHLILNSEKKLRGF
jgi:hypothetical protein